MLAIAFVLGCAGAVRAGEASSDGLPAWEEVAAAPDWLDAPPPREGFVRVIGAGRSNLRHLAYSPASYPEKEAFRAVALRDCRAECARRLRPLLGKEAGALAEGAVTEVSLARRASRYVVHPGPPKQVGGATYTVWALWDVPLAPLLDAVPKPQREAAGAALARSEFADVPWHEGPVPAWVARPEVRPGHAAVLVAERKKSVALAKADLSSFAADRVAGRLIDALTSVLGSREAAIPIALEGDRWRIARARTVRPEGSEGIAWAAWDVPLAPMLERIPEADREKARAALEGVLRAD
jgi:hypothetical protein